MRIQLFNEEIFVGQDSSEIAEVFNRAYKMIEEKGQIYSHISVDGIDVYEDPIDYLMVEEGNIGTVEIKTVSMDRFRVDVLFSIQNYSKNAVPELEKLSGEFYTTPSGESWGKIGQLLEGVQWLEKAASFLSISESNLEVDELAKKLIFTDEIKNMEMAVSQQDLVLISDLLTYELLPRFKTIQQEVAQLLKDEVESNVVS